MVRRLIGDGKLAARLQGTEDRSSCSDRECPICFLNYAEINVTKCCQANLCTECYLQVQPQKPKQTNAKPQNNSCPFCNAPRLLVAVAGKLDSCAVEQRFNEEQQVEAARIHARNGLDDGRAQEQQLPLNLIGHVSSQPHNGFGSSLEQNEYVALMRARTGSIASEGSAQRIANPVQEIEQIAMTPDERHSLEEEMRAQNHHPLAVRLEREEAERRMRNEMEYYQRASSARRNIRDVRGGAGISSLSNSTQQQMSRHSPRYTHQLRLGGSSDLPPVPTHHLLLGSSNHASPVAAANGRDWNRVVVERSARTGHTMDDLAVLEAAIMLSMEEQPQRAGNQMPYSAARHESSLLTRDFSVDDGRSEMYGGASSSYSRDVVPTTFQGFSEEQQIALAIEASLQESAACAPSSSVD